MKNFRGLLVAAAIMIIGMTSCSKGSTGPAGPAGPAGPDSVQYSVWTPLATTYVAADTLFEQTINAPSITQAILDSGVILSYINLQEQNGTYHVVPTAGLTQLGIYEDFTLGKINIESYQDATGLPYRYVVIPGSLKTGNSASAQKVKGYTIQELKAMPYEQVQQLLGN